MNFVIFLAYSLVHDDQGTSSQIPMMSTNLGTIGNSVCRKTTRTGKDKNKKVVNLGDELSGEVRGAGDRGVGRTGERGSHRTGGGGGDRAVVVALSSSSSSVKAARARA
jgi:hypothetical protein